jgi:hypothetical protein
VPEHDRAIELRDQLVELLDHELTGVLRQLPRREARRVAVPAEVDGGDPVGSGPVADSLGPAAG